MGIVGNICTFFKYPKQFNVLKESIERKVPKADATRLNSLCPSQWIEHHDAIIIFLQHFDDETVLQLLIHTTMASAVLVEEAMKDLQENALTEFRKVFVEFKKKVKDIEVDVVPRQTQKINISSEMFKSAEVYY
ncbi:hypothetical protein PR048_021825 [Dryococelus australis]|uniref:Uncharacterized protein n=1 Tax=Dryococelus australis TaxID=614101 RepID=A0ABQ9GZI6_9NEOP|nr:hypothetical protein PR048_021825 [Dryococelus australis]